MNTRSSAHPSVAPATPFITPYLSPIDTPLLSANEAEALALYNPENEAALDPETREIRAEDFTFAKPIPLIRRDATVMEKSDGDRLHRMSLAWNKLKGEPIKRKRTRVYVRKQSRKSKGKKKWIPRKQYLAAKRKAKRR